MPATTPTYGIPYPEATDSPNGPGQMQSLALEVEAELTRIDARHPQGTGAWTAFTTTWTNLTVGDGTSDTAFARHGRLVTARYKVTLGATSVVGTLPTFTLPVNAAAGSALATASIANLRDVSATANYHGIIYIASATLGAFALFGRALATDVVSGVTATTPFTWATGDIIGGTITYEAAS